MILVFSIIFLVFRNNIHQQTLDSSKLCLSEVCHFHPILHSPPSETLHSEKLDLTEICRFRISDVLSSFFLLLLLRRPPTRHVLPYKHSTWHDVNTKKKNNDRSHSYNKKDLTLQVFKKNTKMIYIRSLLQEYTITRTDKRKCTNQ